MRKVTIEITSDGWIEKLELDGETFVKRYKRTATGAKGLDISWEDEHVSDQMYEALSDLMSPCHDVMNALHDE